MKQETGSRFVSLFDVHFVFETFNDCRLAQRRDHLNNGNTSFVNWRYGCDDCFWAEEVVVNTGPSLAVITSALEGSRTLDSRL
jgi:hypothetical protein